MSEEERQARRWRTAWLIAAAMVGVSLATRALGSLMRFESRYRR